jgi:hypothetical protein
VRMGFPKHAPGDGHFELLIIDTLQHQGLRELHQHCDKNSVQAGSKT